RSDRGRAVVGCVGGHAREAGGRRRSRAGGRMRVILGAAALFLSACSGPTEPMPQGGSMVDAQLKADLETMKDAKVFFGHHSVGDNLLEGMRELSAEAGISVKIDEARVGENRDPKSKVDAFVKRVLGNPQDGLQLAYMKFCYVDFEPSTKVDEVLGAYKAAI